MVPSSLARLSVAVATGRREDPLPRPFSPCVGIFALERPGKRHPTGSLGDVPLVLLSHRLQVSRKVGLDRRGEQRRPVLLHLAISNQHLIRSKIDIYDPQTGAFHESETGAVHQRPHQPWDPVKMSQNGLHFRLGQDDGAAARPLGADHAIEPRQLFLQDFFIQKEHGAQGLILR